MPTSNASLLSKRIAIIGASGFVGRHLLRHLLSTTPYTIRTLSRQPTKIRFNQQAYGGRVERVQCDVFDAAQLATSLQDVDTAFYLLHMMGQKGDYYNLEAEAAHAFAKAAQTAGVRRIVFLGGLGNDKDKLSKHLASRHNSGRILRSYDVPVIELRAAMVIGDGSVGYDIIKRLVHKLPVQTLPAWSSTKTQPITLKDMLSYLAACIEVPLSGSQIVEVGGPQQLTYREMVAGYATVAGKKPVLITVPIVPLWLGAWWLNLFTPAHHAKVGREMAESLANPMIVTNDSARRLFPNIRPQPIHKAFIRTTQTHNSRNKAAHG